MSCLQFDWAANIDDGFQVQYNLIFIFFLKELYKLADRLSRRHELWVR